jgi:5'-3' exonuclease
MRYLLVDAMNLFFRARHVAHKGSEISERVAMSLHIVMMSMNKAWRLHNADHIVVCLDGRSWRKDFYSPYKKNREVAREALTDQERDENEEYFSAFGELMEFLEDKTNVTVVSCDIGEADDLIARWIHYHPDDQHTIVSSDTDMVQLLAPNVDQYNGITQELITLNGITNDRGKPVIDKKTKLPKVVEDPQWQLFVKCMRGDPGDNVFSAYPGVRIKGSTKKVGLTEAFADREKKGYAWNNIMLQRWTDHNKVEHRVLEDYKRNVELIDLTAQPAHIKEKLDGCIVDSTAVVKNKQMVGAHFLKFCGRYDLVKLSENASTFGEILSAAYPE